MANILMWAALFLWGAAGGALGGLANELGSVATAQYTAFTGVCMGSFPRSSRRGDNLASWGPF